MKKTIILSDVNNQADLQRLKSYLEELYREVDPIYTETSPHNNITARRGRLALYNNSGTYTLWVNITGSNLWVQV